MPDQTGPTTLAGKERASRNSYKHGIRSQKVALDPVEDQAEWEEFRDGIFDALDPDNGLERALTENICWALWKLRRVWAYQQAITRADMNSKRRTLEGITNGTVDSDDFEAGTQFDVPHNLAMEVIPRDSDLARIQRYEAHLHRQYIQTLRELEAIQARRKGEPISPLARLDMSGAPTT